MVDSSCSPLTLVRRTRSGNLILYADPIRKKLSSDLGRQTHFPFWNTSSPTVATLCYKEHHRFVFSVSYDERILGLNLDFFFLGGGAPLRNDFNFTSCFFCFVFFGRILLTLESRRSSRRGVGEGVHPLHPPLDPLWLWHVVYVTVNMASWWKFTPFTVIQIPECVNFSHVKSGLVILEVRIEFLNQEFKDVLDYFTWVFACKNIKILSLRRSTYLPGISCLQF